MRCFSFILIFAALFLGCSPSSIEDFRHEGESVCREILIDLQQIQSREDFSKFERGLKRKFESLVSIIIEARTFVLEHQDMDGPFFSVSNTDISDAMKNEMERIYKIEGGREIMEKTQREAMLRLDGFEKMRERKNHLRVK